MCIYIYIYIYIYGLSLIRISQSAAASAGDCEAAHDVAEDRPEMVADGEPVLRENLHHLASRQAEALRL